MSGLFQVPWSDYRPDLLDALGRTVSYTVVSFVGAVLLGLAVALLRLSRAWPARALAAVYTEVFKNIPLLAIIFLTYFGLASAGVRLDVFTAGCVSLVVFYAAYLSEIFRSAIGGVHAGQTEAGEALGLGKAGIFGQVVLPQAVRQALPGTNTMLVDLLKSTSLLVTVSAAELMSEGRLITSATFRALEVYLVIGYSFSVDLKPAPRHTLYFGERRAVASPIGATTRIGGTMELSGNNNRLDWRRVVAVALASRHYLGPWFDDPDDLVGLIRDPWVGGRPFLPDGLPVIDRVPGHDNVYAATGHGMLGVTLGPATGHRLAEFVRTGRRPEELAPFRFDRLRGRPGPRREPTAANRS
ncbi:D-amino acid dehydrogenase [Streptomyces alboniger]